MKNVVKFLLVLAIATLIVSCGGKTKKDVDENIFSEWIRVPGCCNGVAVVKTPVGILEFTAEYFGEYEFSRNGHDQRIVMSYGENPGIPGEIVGISLKEFNHSRSQDKHSPHVVHLKDSIHYVKISSGGDFFRIKVEIFKNHLRSVL